MHAKRKETYETPVPEGTKNLGMTTEIHALHAFSIIATIFYIRSYLGGLLAQAGDFFQGLNKIEFQMKNT